MFFLWSVCQEVWRDLWAVVVGTGVWWSIGGIGGGTGAFCTYHEVADDHGEQEEGDADVT